MTFSWNNIHWWCPFVNLVVDMKYQFFTFEEISFRKWKKHKYWNVSNANGKIVSWWNFHPKLNYCMYFTQTCLKVFFWENLSIFVLDSWLFDSPHHGTNSVTIISNERKWMNPWCFNMYNIFSSHIHHHRALLLFPYQIECIWVGRMRKKIFIFCIRFR